MASHIDVSIEQKGEPAPKNGKPHPNTCPKCESHYRDDELEAALFVCSQCSHHFPMPARKRVELLADPGTFVEEAAERLAEAELKTGLGDAMMIGQAAIEGSACELAVMDFGFMGGSMGSVVGEKFVRACEQAVERRVSLVSVTASGGARMQE